MTGTCIAAAIFIACIAGTLGFTACAVMVAAKDREEPEPWLCVGDDVMVHALPLGWQRAKLIGVHQDSGSVRYCAKLGTGKLVLTGPAGIVRLSDPIPVPA